MKNYNALLPLLFFTLIVLSDFNIYAQHVTFNDDEMERGYFNRPYKRYEAETGKCETNGLILEPTFNQTNLQSEASNQISTQLVSKNSYVQWVNDEAADGLTIRFSLPDSEDGKGTTGTLALYVNEEYIQNITLDSYWAWQYILKSGSKYPDNAPATTKFPRMRFDEMHWKLERKIPAGATLKLVKTDDNDVAYTIDFVELEPVPEPVSFESISDANKIRYDQSEKLAKFILTHGGKTIYLPAGKYDVENRMNILNDSTKIIGAGMWYTEIYFTASSDVRATYANRGIETNNNSIRIEGLYLNTINNKRYYDNNSSYQVGKGFMGGFGSNSVISNVWVEHFECGGWIANYAGKGSDNLLVEDCRFRNNYADGFNLCSGIKNAHVEKCSFRNNGDDDMVTWSANEMCINNTFQYNTAENNWRASSLGFFGGQDNKAWNCVIIDPMEAGLRANCDFSGTGFGDSGYNEFNNISIYKGGVAAGMVGTSGDLWGNQQGAIHLNSSSYYDLLNIRLTNIDLYDSKYNAIYIGSGTKKIVNLFMKDIHINGTGQYGVYYYNGVKGDGSYCSITYANIGASANSNTIPTAFTLMEDCSNAIEPSTVVNGFQLTSNNGNLTVSGFVNSSVSVYDMLGEKIRQTAISSDEVVIPGIRPGIYLVRLDKDHSTIVVKVQ